MMMDAWINLLDAIEKQKKQFKDKKNQRFNNSSVNENSRDDTQEV